MPVVVRRSRKVIREEHGESEWDVDRRSTLPDWIFVRIAEYVRMFGEFAGMLFSNQARIVKILVVRMSRPPAFANVQVRPSIVAPMNLIRVTHRAESIP